MCAPVLVIVTGQLLVAPAAPDRGQLAAGQKDGVANRLRRARVRVDRTRKLDGRVGVHEAGTLLGGGRAEIGRRADEDLLDQRRRRGRAMVGLPIGLDHERSHARHERRGLAGAAGLLDVGGLTDEVGAVRIGRAGIARGEAQVAGGDQADSATGLVEPTGAQRADVVVEPAGGREVARGGVVGLGVEAEVGRPSDRDDLRVGGGRADRVGEPAVAGRDADDDAGCDGCVVELLRDVERRDVRERIRPERLVDHVDVVVSTA